MPELSLEELLKRMQPMIDDSVAKAVKAASPEPPLLKRSETEQEDKPEHLMREWEKYCPDCGEENKNYRAPKFKCKNCKSPVGTDLEKIDKCPYCGSTNAEEIEFAT